MENHNCEAKMEIRNVGSNLKFFRNLTGLSQEKVADQAKISRSFYKSLESTNDSAPSLSTLMSICTVLKIPLDFVVKDCGIRLFSDYANSEILKQIQNQTDEVNAIYSAALLALYEQLHKGDILTKPE